MVHTTDSRKISRVIGSFSIAAGVGIEVGVGVGVQRRIEESRWGMPG